LPSAYHSMHEADLVLLLGTDFPYIPFMPKEKKLVQIDTRPERLGRRAKLEMGLHGDIHTTLQALLPLLKENEEDGFLKAQLQVYEKVKEHLDIYVNDRGKMGAIHPEFVASCINKLASDDAIFTVDTGMCCVWGARYIHATGQRKMLGSWTHGSMANALPHAIGASLSFPGRQVVAFCGDGGLSMLLGDLATVKQYNLPIKIIVFNNHSLGMVKLEMEVGGFPDNETDMVNPDFALVAEAMGFRGITIDDPDNVEAGLIEAFHFNGPVLVNMITDPNALAMPPKMEWKQMVGMTESMTKLMLGGKMEEVLDTVRSNYKHLKEVLD
jgi:pyruvate dehydrogenase (quinone)